MPDEPSPLETAINIVKQKDYPASARLNTILYMVENYNNQACLDTLEEILLDSAEEADIRSAAALALGKLGGDRALTLLKRMAHAEDKTLKNYSLQGLGLLGREEGVPILLDALKDQDNDIFASAAEALGKIGKPVVPHLIQLLDSTHAEDARCIAAWQLGLLRYTDAVPPLLNVIRSADNPDLIALSIWALGEIGQDAREVLDTLKWAQAQENPAINERAKLAIKKIARHIN